MKNEKRKNVEIIILASGAGSTFEAIAQFFNTERHVNIGALVTDRPCYALKRAETCGISAYLCDKAAKQNGEHFYDIDEIISIRNPRLIVLAGFLGILPRWFTSLYSGRIINIHPSLLPAYGGKGMYGNRVHSAVLAAGEKESGCTVHWVTEIIDGGAIIDQERVAVMHEDSVESLAQRVQEVERMIYPRVIATLCVQDLRGRR